MPGVDEEILEEVRLIRLTLWGIVGLVALVLFIFVLGPKLAVLFTCIALLYLAFSWLQRWSSE